jgi:hypothetical protein
MNFMSVAPFDTLKLAGRLESGGFSAEQARTAPSALAEAMTGAELATKSDLGLLRSDLDVLKNDLKNDIVQLEQRLTIRLGGMLVIAVGILLAAIRYLPSHP